MEKQLQRVVEAIPDPCQGLPDPVFDFVLKVTPVINVDLLVQDDGGRALLSWREDPFGTGWHIPGGIVRYRERLETRIAAVARLELGTTVEAEDQPCDMVQFNREPRGHFISLLFRCRLTEGPDEALMQRYGVRENGALAWIKGTPSELYPAHRVYQRWLRSA
jgi:colanic acid biosynthesis protein WcaH